MREQWVILSGKFLNKRYELFHSEKVKQTEAFFLFTKQRAKSWQFCAQEVKNLLWYFYKSRTDYTIPSFLPNHNSSDAVGRLLRLVFLCTKSGEKVRFLGLLPLGNVHVIYWKWENVISWRVNAGKSWRLFNFPQLSLLSNYSIKIFSSCQNCLPKLFSTSRWRA